MFLRSVSILLQSYAIPNGLQVMNFGKISDFPYLKKIMCLCILFWFKMTITQGLTHELDSRSVILNQTQNQMSVHVHFYPFFLCDCEVSIQWGRVLCIIRFRKEKYHVTGLQWICNEIQISSNIITLAQKQELR